MVEVVDPLGEPEIGAPDVAELREITQRNAGIAMEWVRGDHA
jgi:hypothetical protein